MSEKSIQNDDVVRIHLVGRVNSFMGPVFQVTEEAVAKAEGVAEDDKHAHYEPKLVIVGKKQVIDGVDEALVGMKVGEEKNVEIPAEKAFGKSDPKKKRIMSFREFKVKFKKAPRLGDTVELQQSREQARITRIDQGKIFLDTNHMLADRTVFYTVKVIEKIEGEDARLNALIEQRMPGIPTSEFKLNKAGNVLEITLPSQVMFFQQSGFMQYLLAMEIQKDFPQFEKIRYIMEIEKPKMPEKPIEPAPAEKKEEKPAGTVETAAKPADAPADDATEGKKGKKGSKKSKKSDDAEVPATEAKDEKK
nr:FKBP-type peptidyl-prolyl cis-trans isomerase [Candidatus Sigynarchaeota archaeon]